MRQALLLLSAPVLCPCIKATERSRLCVCRVPGLLTTSVSSCLPHQATMAPPRRRHLAAAPQRRTRTRLLAALTLAAAALAPAAAAQLDLAGSCNVQTAQLAHSWLGLYCNNLNTASYGYNWTWIDLDWCVANRGGQLVGKKEYVPVSFFSFLPPIYPPH